MCHGYFFVLYVIFYFPLPKAAAGQELTREHTRTQENHTKTKAAEFPYIKTKRAAPQGTCVAGLSAVGDIRYIDIHGDIGDLSESESGSLESCFLSKASITPQAAYRVLEGALDLEKHRGARGGVVEGDGRGMQAKARRRHRPRSIARLRTSLVVVVVVVVIESAPRSSSCPSLCSRSRSSSRCPCPAGLPCAVEVVSEDGVADGRHVHPQLVRASGDGRQLHSRGPQPLAAAAASASSSSSSSSSSPSSSFVLLTIAVLPEEAPLREAGLASLGEVHHLPGLPRRVPPQRQVHLALARLHCRKTTALRRFRGRRSRRGHRRRCWCRCCWCCCCTRSGAAGRQAEASLDERRVALARRVAPELLVEGALRLDRARQHEDPRGGLVEPVHDHVVHALYLPNRRSN